VSGIELRLLDGDDWALWRDIRLRALQEAPTAFGSTYQREVGFEEDDWRRRLDPEKGPSVLAFADGRPIGMGAGYQDVVGWLHVVAMWVEPAWRGQGVARSLLDRLVGWARSRDLRTHLDVTVGNGAARRLYEGYGFVGTGRSEPLREGSAESMERMVLPSPPATPAPATPAPPTRHFHDDTPQEQPRK
jgi:ribosomal protein S18 acetylase RimI-like enzyme